MLLTERIGSAAGSGADIPCSGKRYERGRRSGPVASRRPIAGFGALRPAGVLLGVVLGGLVQERHDLLRHRLDQAPGLYVGLSVPTLPVRGDVTVVVRAAE